jgi:hypothetical protein
MVGTKKAIAISAKNNRVEKRYSNLERYLRQTIDRNTSLV